MTTNDPNDPFAVPGSVGDVPSPKQDDPFAIPGAGQADPFAAPMIPGGSGSPTAPARS